MRQLSDQGFEEVAKRFRVLSDPGRLRILDLLRRHGELAVGAIAEHVGCSQGNASRQLSQMRDAGFLDRRATGNTVLYFVSDPWAFSLCETVCGRLEKDESRNPGSLFANTAPAGSEHIK